MRRYILSIILLLSTIVATADSKTHTVKTLWDKAATQFAEQQYTDAIATYQEIVKLHGTSAALCYNIGNCYFKQGDLAEAILFYYRADRLDPNNENIEYNLEVAKGLTLNKIAEQPEFVLFSWLKGVANGLSTNGWAIISVIAFSVMMAMVVLFIISKRSNIRKITFTAGVFTLVLAIVSIICSSYIKHQLLRTDEGVIMESSVPVKSSPDSDGKDLFILGEGIKVTIEEQLGSWSNITISSGESGWVESSNISVI